MRRGQAINTTRRHARRQATPKARFIRARMKGWFLPRKSSYHRLIGFQLSKCRRLRAFLSYPSSATPPFAKSLWSSLWVRFHLLDKRICHWFRVASSREEIILAQICLTAIHVQLQSIWMEIMEGWCTLMNFVSKCPGLKAESAKLNLNAKVLFFEYYIFNIYKARLKRLHIEI